MQTLAQILAGQGGNPYQQGAGISPLVQQLLLANQVGGSQVGEQNPMQTTGAMPPAQPGMPQAVPGQPQLPQIGSLGAAAGLTNGIY